MEWTNEAEEAVGKAPFFVRKKIRKRVEKEASQAGKTIVTITDVKATQKRFMMNMESEVKGYSLEACFGSGGCPNRIMGLETLMGRIETVLKDAKLFDYLKSRINGPLKFHHEFNVTMADCPNACSRPQIKDIGIIAADVPMLTDDECSHCGECVTSCREHGITLTDDDDRPSIDFSQCVMCGACIRACPTGTIATDKKGLRILLGGKLGRRPTLGKELPGVFSEDETVEIVKKCLEHYKTNSNPGERFGALLQRIGSDFL